MPQAPRAREWSTPKSYSAELSKFRGVDLTSSVVNVETSRSPDAPNLMPDADGFPSKRPGWETIVQLEGTVHGAYKLTAEGSEKRLVHAGTKLYQLEEDETGTIRATVIRQGMNDVSSTAVQLGGKLWILDGKTYLYYDGAKVAPVSEIATVPRITIAKAPNGQYGATSDMPINLLTGWRTDSFAGLESTASEKEYFLSYNELSDAELKVEVLTSSENGADWVVKKEGSDYTVNRELGKITFATAPGKSPLDGEDNVRITYEVKENHVDTINKCRLAILYGVNGAMDRLFVSGNPDEQNIDYWSEWNDPTYFGDTWYGMVGQEASPIVGYSILSDMLVTHKRGEENSRNAVVRKGELDEEGFATFRITNVIQGEGAISSRAFGSLSSEPLFLTASGVMALTPSDVTGERYAQSRSWYLEGALRKESLVDAPATSWDRFYVLAAGNRLYLLDSRRKSYQSKAPYSEYQYDAWYWEVAGVSSLWSWDDQLFFGTQDGKVRRFRKIGAVSTENDDGQAISAHWTTPLMNLGSWGNLKTVTGVWVVGQPYSRSGGSIYYATDKDYATLVRDYTIDVFDWNDIDFNRWTFNTLDRPTIAPTRKKAKKIKLFQVKVENNTLNERFGIFAIQINYRMGGKIKR